MCRVRRAVRVPRMEEFLLALAVTVALLVVLT